MEAATTLLNLISMYPKFKDYLTKMKQEENQGNYSKKIAFQRSILRIQLAQMKWLENQRKLLKGGVLLVFKDRVEADSLGYCDADNIPVDIVKRFLPVDLVDEFSSKYNLLFLFLHSMVPYKGKKLSEIMRDEELMTYYKKLTASIKKKYYSMYSSKLIKTVAKIDLNKPVESQTQRMNAITKEITYFINEDTKLL